MCFRLFGVEFCVCLSVNLGVCDWFCVIILGIIKKIWFWNSNSVDMGSCNLVIILGRKIDKNEEIGRMKEIEEIFVVEIYIWCFLGMKLS